MTRYRPAQARAIEVIHRAGDVAAGRDPDRESRAAFAAREVCVNHPDATSAVIAALGVG